MNDTPPTTEAVEAAMKYATFKEYSAADFAALNDYSQDPCEPTIGTAARILAAEVERLRAELKEAKDWHPRIIRKTKDDASKLIRLRLENEGLRARVAELEQTATPLPRPDKPGWLPIETAPKDGTHIVLGECGERGWWFQEDWYISEDDFDDWQFSSDPLFWMPLPATPLPAPKEEGEE